MNFQKQKEEKVDLVVQEQNKEVKYMTAKEVIENAFDKKVENVIE